MTYIRSGHCGVAPGAASVAPGAASVAPGAASVAPAKAGAHAVKQLGPRLRGDDCRNGIPACAGMTC